MNDKDNNSVVIDIKGSGSTTEKYFCSYCNTRLTYTQVDILSALNVRLNTGLHKSSKFDLPGPPTESHGNIIGDKDIPIAIQDTPEASSIAYKQKKLSAACEALSRYGFKFTTYEER
jgi:hypothetical protein